MALMEPTTQAGAAGLSALLAAPAQAVVALDFDGTLAPIVEDPEQARAHPQAVAALARLAPHVGALAVITGRPAQVAVDYGGFAGIPQLGGLIVLGHYGMERWDAGHADIITPQTTPGFVAAVDAVRAALPEVLAGLDLPSGTTVEDKGNALAVHTRRTADPERAMETLRGPLSMLAVEHGLVVEPGRMVLELRPTGTDKGAALTALVMERQAATVVFAGDDLGDLAAFEAIDTMRTSGAAGIKVCSGSTEVAELARQADLVVDGPEGVITWMLGLADALTQHQGAAPPVQPGQMAPPDQTGFSA